MTARRMGKVYEFEGEELTLRQIQERLPVLSTRTIQKHVEEGRTTRREILSYDGASKSRAASIANAKKRKRMQF
jgi:hypothetical protein